MLKVFHMCLLLEIPLGALCSVFALASALAFVGLKWSLSRQTYQDLAAYQGVVKVVPQAANVTFTLP